MSHPSKKSSRREIRQLLNKAVAQIAIAGDENSTPEQKTEALQRLAEIRLRIKVLRDEVHGP